MRFYCFASFFRTIARFSKNADFRGGAKVRRCIAAVPDVDKHALSYLCR